MSWWREVRGRIVAGLVTGLCFGGPVSLMALTAPPMLTSVAPPTPPPVVHLRITDPLDEGVPEDGPVGDEDGGDVGEEVAASAVKGGGGPAVAPKAPVADTSTRKAPERPSKSDTASSGRRGGEALVATKRVRTPPKRRRGNRCGGRHEGIRRVAAGQYEIDRELAMSYASIRALTSLGWSRPYRGDGVKGWEVGGFNCRSLPARAGLKHKDVLRRINGKKTNTILQLFFMKGMFKKNRHFVVEILRDGTPMTLRYTLV